jgi:NitT/TauT family transport system permease protein
VPKFVMPSPQATLNALLVPELSLAREHRRHRRRDFRRLLPRGGHRHRHRAAVSWSRWLNMAVMPLLVTLNMIPKVALGPLIIVWFKYGIGPNMMMAFAICFFPSC